MTSCLVSDILPAPREISLCSILTKVIPCMPCTLMHTPKPSFTQFSLFRTSLLPWFPELKSSSFRIQIKRQSLQEAWHNSSVWIRRFSELWKHSRNPLSLAFIMLKGNFLTIYVYTSPLKLKTLEGLGVCLLEFPLPGTIFAYISCLISWQMNTGMNESYFAWFVISTSLLHLILILVSWN